jgi:hypothetical protein
MLNGGFEVTLIFVGNFGKRCILPLELIAHSPTGKNGHREFGTTKSTVLHGMTVLRWV